MSFLPSFRRPNKKTICTRGLQQFIFHFYRNSSKHPWQYVKLRGCVSWERGHAAASTSARAGPRHTARWSERLPPGAAWGSARAGNRGKKVNIYNNPRIFSCLCGSSFCLLLILKDDARCRLGVLQRELEELKGERDSAQSRLTQLQNSLQEYQEGNCSCSFRKTLSKGQNELSL